MNDKHRRRRDFIQNIAITVLAVSAVLLFAQTQLYSLGSGNGFRRLFFGSVRENGSAGLVQEQPLAAPVRFVVSGTYGRYGNISATVSSDETLRSLLREVLGSTGTFTACIGEDFYNALESTSVYFDFLSPLPLSILGEMAGTSGSDSLSARRLIVSGQTDPVTLFLWDGSDDYLSCTTAVSLKTLEQIAGQYELGNASFAMDLVKTNPSAGHLEPCSLFLDNTPDLPSLSVEIPAYEESLLLAGLGFNPNTKNRYTDNDTEVISESCRSLRIRRDGSIVYQSGGNGALAVDAAGELPTMAEAAAGTGTLLNSLLAPAAGDEGLYLTGIRQNDRQTYLTFSYQVDGVPIRFSDGQDAAKVILDGSAVSSLSLRIRRYSKSESISHLLPLRQALAIASRQSGAELSLGYADHGGSVETGWLAD